ncbi:hypothetical protein [Robertkochia marina]|uniref:hypothetical protein n=1 Tax=Robertkochia marina TaxID=1227945 RepID=UPI0010A4696B|nr:hypothetical protein [Robertkochia marina]
MKILNYKPFNITLVLALMCSAILQAQTQTKRYSEKFNVDEDVEVAVNTTYTDLIFETWSRDQVEVEAIIEVEGITEEEAERLFKKWNFNALGNSDKITVSTGSGFHFRENDRMAFATTIPGNDFSFNYQIEVPDVDMIFEALPQEIVIPPIPPLPPMPGNMKSFQFDYDAYKADGEAYMKEWKKQFEKNFDEEYMKAYEEWGKQVKEFYGQEEKQRAEMDKNRAEMEKERAKMLAERQKMKEEIRKELEENRAETRIMLEKVREEARRASREAREAAKVYGYRVQPGSDAKIFFYENDGMPKNLKIKKTIRIKAPKGARLKLDVRHGEIKLAENYKDINATLSYTRLHAPLVDGKDTRIKASYSPMKVDYWKEGALHVNYAKALELKKVQNINLSSKSSNVVVKELDGNAIINGSFGDLIIEKVNENFSSLDIVLENSDAVLVLPSGAFDFYTRATQSRISTPATLHLKVNELYNTKQIKGYNKSKGSGRIINIIANYSTVNLKGI